MWLLRGKLGVDTHSEVNIVYSICPVLDIVFQGLVIPFLLTHIPTLSLLQGREATRAAGWLYPWFSRRPSYWHVREMIWSSLMASGS